MIGSKNIGKSTFLKSLTNNIAFSSNERAKDIKKEIYEVNLYKDNLMFEIENRDISLETYLNDDDIVLNNNLVLSNQIINTSKFDVIILSFSLDDRQTFELIKSKWETYLRKIHRSNRTQNFILLGLKHDELRLNYSEYVRSCVKKRSRSVDSSSSNSELHLHKNQNRIDSKSEKETFLKEYNKFAKKIGANQLLEAKIQPIANNIGLFQLNPKGDEEFEEIGCANFIEILSKTVLKTRKIEKLINCNSSSPHFKRSKTMPRIFNRKSRQLVDLRNENIKHSHANENPCLSLSQDTQNMNVTTNSNLKNNENDNLQMNNPNEFYMKTNQNKTFKDKLSKYFIGIGTYMVTCGTKKTELGAHKLGVTSTKSKVPILRNKKWNLLNSETSLNTIENRLASN